MGKRNTKFTEGKGQSTGAFQLVIVESPAKAATIQKYLGPGFLVMASMGHIRDLPSKNLPGDRRPVPGVNLRDFSLEWEIISKKAKVVAELKRAAKRASDIWLASDLDREGEAIAWHLAQVLEVPPERVKRVAFNAITKAEIARAFANPQPINQPMVDSQLARRVLDRIVGYLVSALLREKVPSARSAGRVQSPAARLIVEREREIRAFVPDESWRIAARFTLDPSQAANLAQQWIEFLGRADAQGKPPTIRAQHFWLAEHGSFTAELIEVGGRPFEIAQPGIANKDPADLTESVKDIVMLAGLRHVRLQTTENPKGKGPARFDRAMVGDIDVGAPYRIASIETKRTRSRPSAPFITSTLQQAASSQHGFGAKRTMTAAQHLYEGLDVPGHGPVGLITYMRTDSTHLSDEALTMARAFIKRAFGASYLPPEPTSYSSPNKSAQEAHEAIRPTNVELTPSDLKNALKPDELKLYTLIWERFVACQMVPAEWDSTTVLITGGVDSSRPLTFKSTGRVLVFDGYYKAVGVPSASEEQRLPVLSDGAPVAPFSVEPQQRFGSPPARFTEASLIKTLESEGIGRPSTYASIISVIQERGYVEQRDRRFHATYLGEFVTDFLATAFCERPQIMELGYTRELESDLDRVAFGDTGWITLLREFYEPLRAQLEKAKRLPRVTSLTDPEERSCADCGAPAVIRIGKFGAFLSCSQFPRCKWKSSIHRDDHSDSADASAVACPKCGRAMVKQTGRYGPFLGCSGYRGPENPCDAKLKLDKQGRPLPPVSPPLATDIPCPNCQCPLQLRRSVRGIMLSCSAFPKCRGRGKWSELSDADRKKWEESLAKHEAAHPSIVICDMQGNALTCPKCGRPTESVVVDAHPVKRCSRFPTCDWTESDDDDLDGAGAMVVASQPN